MRPKRPRVGLSESSQVLSAKRPRATPSQAQHAAESMLPIEVWRGIARCIAECLSRRDIGRSLEALNDDETSLKDRNNAWNNIKPAIKGLCSLAQTCQFFYLHDVAAEWLYRYVYIRNGETAALFLHTLHDRPRLRKFIQHLTIWSIDQMSCRKGFLSREWRISLHTGLELSLFPEQVFGTAFRDAVVSTAIMGGRDDTDLKPHLATAVLAAILSLLLNLRSLCLSYPVIAHTDAPQILWNTLEKLYEHTSRAGGERPMSIMSDLSFIATGVKATYFDHTWVSTFSKFTDCLKHLHLAVARDMSNLTTINSSITNLESLRLSYMRFDDRTLDSYIDAAQTLRELDICLGGDGSSPFWNWVGTLDNALPQLGQTLERLRIDTGHARTIYANGQQHTLRNLGYLQNLAFLQIPFAFLFSTYEKTLIEHPSYINTFLPTRVKILLIQEVWTSQVDADSSADYAENITQFLEMALDELRNLTKLEFQAQWDWSRYWWFNIGGLPAKDTATFSIVSLFPGSPASLSHKIGIYLSIGRYTAAVQEATMACGLSPQSRRAIVQLACTYTAAGRPEEAMAILAKLSPPPSSDVTGPSERMLYHIKKATKDLHDGNGGEQVLALLRTASEGLGDEETWPERWKVMEFRAYFLAGLPDAALQVVEDMLTPTAFALKGWAETWLGDDEAAMTSFHLSHCLRDISHATAWQWTLEKLTLLVPTAGYSALRTSYLRSAVDKILAVLSSTSADGCIATAMILHIRALHHMDLTEYDKALVDAEKAAHLSRTDELSQRAFNVAERARTRIS